ncbi:MAG: peptidoglycan DD-metalloendopeptidase family protein [Betaproteobacteria bacterium]|jgi:lipoprotein NlpD|nr:peptidoglycan DD-metalloendopeptidase family protein [Betaproteobacteria bacterium]
MRIAGSIGPIAALAAALLVAACASRPTSAPVIDRGAASASQPSDRGIAGATHVVQRGETLYSIALEHGVDYRDVARWNGLGDGTRISVGQRLRLSPPEAAPLAAAPTPKGVEVGSAPRAGGGVEARPLDSGAMAAQGQSDGAMKTGPKALRLPYSKENVAMLSSRGGADVAASAASVPPAYAPSGKAPAPGTQAETASAASAGGLGFVWPAKGKLLNGFSEPNSKGVDIAGKPGDPVVAAAPGRVMYTGTGIRGYGKLIVIKHDDGFNSVYAHNRSILVKEGQSVARGERIAELGSTDSDRPKLHFEIRKSGKPVDPMKYLPPAPPS